MAYVVNSEIGRSINVFLSSDIPLIRSAGSVLSNLLQNDKATVDKANFANVEKAFSGFALADKTEKGVYYSLIDKKIYISQNFLESLKENLKHDLEVAIVHEIAHPVNQVKFSFEERKQDILGNLRRDLNVFPGGIFQLDGYIYGVRRLDIRDEVMADIDSVNYLIRKTYETEGASVRKDRLAYNLAMGGFLGKFVVSTESSYKFRDSIEFDANGEIKYTERMFNDLFEIRCAAKTSTSPNANYNMMGEFKHQLQHWVNEQYRIDALKA
ncbi:hypothetical protein V8J88_15570 [Massilia sp. W12]|uniref:hypothetical protein n=1 Tax=Massilia sp. W12 TaxID=3126507 RepID=UPI0030D39357